MSLHHRTIDKDWWIVRNSTGELWAFNNLPIRTGGSWSLGDSNKIGFRIPSELFPNQFYEDKPLLVALSFIVEVS